MPNRTVRLRAGVCVCVCVFTAVKCWLVRATSTRHISCTHMHRLQALRALCYRFWCVQHANVSCCFVARWLSDVEKWSPRRCHRHRHHHRLRHTHMTRHTFTYVLHRLRLLRHDEKSWKEIKISHGKNGKMRLWQRQRQWRWRRGPPSANNVHILCVDSDELRLTRHAVHPHSTPILRPTFIVIHYDLRGISFQWNRRKINKNEMEKGSERMHERMPFNPSSFELPSIHRWLKLAHDKVCACALLLDTYIPRNRNRKPTQTNSKSNAKPQ